MCRPPVKAKISKSRAPALDKISKRKASLDDYEPPDSCQCGAPNARPPCGWCEDPANSPECPECGREEWVRVIDPRTSNLVKPCTDQWHRLQGECLSVAEAKRLLICRFCLQKEGEGPGYPFVYEYGGEYAHLACLKEA